MPRGATVDVGVTNAKHLATRREALESQSWKIPAVRRLVGALRTTRLLRRLKNISFLGAVDYLPPHQKGKRNGRRVNRYEHSIGVARLADYYAAVAGHDEKNRLLLVAAALLHDIGHLPLSHSQEPVFKERFGLDHHALTRRAILGEPPFGDDVCRALVEYKVDPERVVEALEEGEPAFHGFLTGRINLDTIDAITRLAVGNPDKVFHKARSVVEAAFYRADDHHRARVDAFWGEKDKVYQRHVYHAAGLAADEAACRLMRRHWRQWDLEAALWDDLTFQRRLAVDLTDMLKSLDPDNSRSERRVFFINSQAEFSCWTRDCERYLYRWEGTGRA